jgi:hypothetical protein
MAANIIDIKSYSPESSDVFFFDNNVWMYLFCPLASYNQNRQKHYSLFLQTVQGVKCTIFINSLILSEFANRYLRLDFELWKKETKNFKVDFKRNFIGSERYKDTIVEIKINVTKILRICEKSPDNFNLIDLNKVFSHLENIDFNDSYYIEMAQLSNWRIVTDDSDFVKYKGHNLDIITIVKEKVSS